METTATALTDGEINLAMHRLELWSNRPINRAVRFHNSLEAFVRDVDRELGVYPTVRLLCVDTTEIFSFADYRPSVWHAFTFNRLLESVDMTDDVRQGHHETTITLDRLINWHLLFDRRDGCILLDPHADELVDIESAISKKIDLQQSRLDQQIKGGDLSALSSEQLERIFDWLQNRGADQEREFLTFRNTFLPGLRADLVEYLYKSLKIRDAYRKFRTDGKYYFIAPSSAGGRSFLHALNARGIAFDWREFETFTTSSNAQHAFENIAVSVLKLINTVDRAPRSEGAKEAAADRDARALATIHVLNLFLRKKHLPVRAELVTRAPILHDIISALPAGQLHVTLRHPLLVPEVYEFDPPSLATIGHVYKSVTSALRPVLEEYGSSDKLSAQTSTSPSDLNQADAFVREAALELQKALADIVVIQQTMERDRSRELIEELLVSDKKAREKRRSDRREVAHIKVDEEIRSEHIIKLFDLLRERLQRHRDPFSVEAINNIADNNLRLIDFERRRLGASAGQTIRFRFLRIEESDAGFPVEFTAFRPLAGQPAKVERTPAPLGGRLPRLFHLYSKRAQALLDDRHSVRGSANEPLVSEPISIGTLLDVARRALTDLDDRAAQHGEQAIEKIEETMLVCVAFASIGHYSTAATLASTVLNQVMRQLRETGSEKFTRTRVFPKGADPKLPLALKELFLLRHYCERAVGREQLENGRKLFGGSKGLGVRNFARAQRDLDIAVQMNEHAEALSRRASETGSSPAGIDWFAEFRFPLISFFGWMDQYVASLTLDKFQEKDVFERWEVSQTRELWRRHDIWTTGALAKEIEIVAWRARARSERSIGNEERRYFVHIEARALHGLLVLLVIHLAFDISAEVQTFWNPVARPTSDRLLFFRSWKDWWHRYRHLLSSFRFEMRLSALFDCVFETIEEIENIARERQARQIRDRYRQTIHFDAAYKSAINSLVDRLRDARSQFVRIDGDMTFAVKLVDQLLEKTEHLQRL